MEILKKIFNWIVWSSANPEKISLTLKALIPFLVFLKFSTPETLQNSSQSIVDLLISTGTLISALTLFYGSARKVAISLSKVFQ